MILVSDSLKGDERMEIRWGSSKGRKNALTHNAQVREDAAQTIVRERMHGSLMDQIVQEHAQSGGFDHLEGKGKPLDLTEEVTENFYLHRAMKNAEVLPFWLELQHEIRDQIRRLIERTDREPNFPTHHSLAEINQKIKKFNQACPSSAFEKPLISETNYKNQLMRWE